MLIQLPIWGGGGGGGGLEYFLGGLDFFLGGLELTSGGVQPPLTPPVNPPMFSVSVNSEHSGVARGSGGGVLCPFHFYTLNDCLTFCYNTIYKVLSKSKINIKSWKFSVGVLDV